MKHTTPLSPTDIAQKKFDALKTSGFFTKIELEDLNESDTRSKIIDPLFKEVLGWRETEITREQPAAEGYADYVFGAGFSYFHVEAKRSNPRFRLNAPSKNRILELNGSHLLGQATLRPHLEQAAKYAGELGTDYSILTNGTQLILFKNRLPGRSWKTGRAIVWHDWEDIENNFADFFGLLSREEVVNGSLHQAFDEAQEITANLYTPRTIVHNPDLEFVRNPFWHKISAVFGPLMTDQPTDYDLQNEIIQNCYVRTPLSDQADTTIEKLIKDTPSNYLKNAGVTDIKIGTDGKSKFDRIIEADVKNRNISNYILTGGVGSGKTTFLKRYERLIGTSLIKEYCVWLHIDFLAAGSSLVDAGSLQKFIYSEIRSILKERYSDICPNDGEDIRKLFGREIEDLKLTQLYGVDEGTPQWNFAVNERTHACYTDDEKLVTSIFLRTVPVRGKRVVIVLDNTDQLGEHFQEQIFLLSQKISQSCGALTIVALREEKFFAAHRRGVFDAYGDRRFHVGSPNLTDVIKRRLEYGLKKYKSSATARESEDSKAVAELINVFIKSATQKNHNIVRLLACVSNGDMRHALGMFRDFISSGNTDINKILDTLKQKGSYIVPFHEFAKSAILGSKRYFNSSSSHTINVFMRTSARRSSHLTAARLLARLNSAQNAPSKHGAGFVETSLILGEYRESFVFADDLILKADELTRRGLLESEPPKCDTLEKTEAIRISASGAYYWQYLMRSFAYLDLVFLDTPIKDKGVSEKLGAMASISDLSSRFERVRLFLDYLEKEEEVEIQAVSGRNGVYTSPLIPDISSKIEEEIDFITRKTGAVDLQNES